MSVGVCVINRNGIALAADSAGTFTGGNRMFYNSMNKVFSLSSKNAYGAITYGTSTIYNASIEQILKEFGLFLDSQEDISDFFDIVTCFENFIVTRNQYYKFNNAELEECESLIGFFLKEWGNKLKVAITSSDVETELDKILNEINNLATGSAKIDNYDVSEYIKITYSDKFDELISDLVPEINKYSQKKDELWNNICKLFNLSLVPELKHKTGLFFAGYGKSDAYPKCIGIEIFNVFNGKIKYRQTVKFEESNNNAKIFPMAQDEVILTFCRGISSSFIDNIPSKTVELIQSKIDQLPSEFSDDQKQKIKKHLETVDKEIKSEINTMAQNENVNPIFASVQLIPLTEMAFLAENLVNITSLKRTFALDGNQQTVGGPTDVAILSKGDGFVWIKKKTSNP